MWEKRTDRPNDGRPHRSPSTTTTPHYYFLPHLLSSHAVRKSNGNAHPARHDGPPQAQLEASPGHRRYCPRNAHVHPHPRRGGIASGSRAAATRTTTTTTTATSTAAVGGRFRRGQAPYYVRKRPEYEAQQRDPVASTPCISLEGLCMYVNGGGSFVQVGVCTQGWVVQDRGIVLSVSPVENHPIGHDYE